MESIYKLQGKAAEIANQYNELLMQFENLMEENGGELTPESQEYIDHLAALENLKVQIKEDILKFPDEYASWYKNVEARKKVHEAELKAFKELQAAAVAKYEAKVKKDSNDLNWIRQNIADAMTFAKVKSFDKKSRPNALFSIYFLESKTVEVDEAKVNERYQDVISTANAAMPEGYSLVLKVDKNVLRKVETLPEGAQLITGKSLVIK